MVRSPRSPKPEGSKSTDSPQPAIRNIQLDSIGHHPPSDSPLRNRVPQPPPPFLSSGHSSSEPLPENTRLEPSLTISAEPSPPDSPQYPHRYLRQAPRYIFRLPPRILLPLSPYVPLYPWFQAMYQPPAPQGQPQPLFPWARALTRSRHQPPSPPPPPPPSPSPPQQTDHERFLTNVIIYLVIVDIFALGLGMGCYFVRRK